MFVSVYMCVYVGVCAYMCVNYIHNGKTKLFYYFNFFFLLLLMYVDTKTSLFYHLSIINLDILLYIFVTFAVIQICR